MTRETIVNNGNGNGSGESRLSSRKDTVDDKQVLRGAEILRAQLLAATKQRLEQQQNHPLLRSSRQEQPQRLSRKSSTQLKGALHESPPYQESSMQRTKSTHTSTTTKVSNTSGHKYSNCSPNGTKNGSSSALGGSAQLIGDSTGAIADLCMSMPLRDHTNQSRRPPQQTTNVILITNLVSVPEGAITGVASDQSDTLSSKSEDLLNALSKSHSRMLHVSNEQLDNPRNSLLNKIDWRVNASNLQQQIEHQISTQKNCFNNDVSKDKAYQHAQMAGLLWQTLVGEQVRFPKSWYNGQRSRPMMSDASSAPSSPWMYISKYRVRANPFLNQLVQSANALKRVASKGRLILHLVIQDQTTWKPIQDIVVGCFHPKYVCHASIEREDLNSDIEDDSRDIWLALRKTGQTTTAPTSLIDSILCVDKKWKNTKILGKKSPIGDEKGLVTNDNVAAIYGEKPPLKTVVINENVAFELLCQAKERSTVGTSNPAILLLHEFLFKHHYD